LIRRKHIQYREGQWFVIPLRAGGYALGTIVRGCNKTKGGLGYFFGPKYREIPDDKVIWEKSPADAILITWFSDLGIINGSWPLLRSTRPFSIDDWPIPKFGHKDPLVPGKGYIREYTMDAYGSWMLKKESIVAVEEIIDFPEDVFMGGGAVEIKLTKLLSDE